MSADVAHLVPVPDAPIDPDAHWLAWRGKGVGGSDIPALLGLSRYASPTSLYFDKLGLLPRREDSQRQRIGKRMEAVLAAEFLDETGLHCVGEQTMCEHAVYPWARCTTDGFAAEWPLSPVDLARDGDRLLGTVQMKTDGRHGWPDGVPANIRAQCVWEMGVTGMTHCWLIVMFAGFRVQVFEIPWDDDAQADWAYMLGVAERFWTQNVQGGICPPIDGHDATTAALTEIHHDPDGDLQTDDAGRLLVARLRVAKSTTKAAEHREAQLSNELRALIGDRVNLIDGYVETKKGPRPIVLASWRTSERVTLDAKELRAAHPELCAEFERTTPTRTLRVNADKP